MSLGFLILLSGNVDVCASNGSTLIDNKNNGFDLYPINRSTPTRTFKVDANRRFVKGCAFAEVGKAVVCGSDHRKVYIFGIDDEKPRQILRHGSADDMIQAVEVRDCTSRLKRICSRNTQATSTQSNHFIVTSAYTGKCNIHVWKKVVAAPVSQ